MGRDNLLVTRWAWAVPCLLALLLAAGGDAHAGALDLSAPQVQRWLPVIARRCTVLSRLPDISQNDKVLFVDVFAGMLEDLSQGKAPLARYAGKTLAYGYWSEHTQRIEGHKLFVPPGYDPNKEYQLFVYYKMGGGGIGDWANCGPPWQPTAEMCAKAPDTFHVWSNLSTQVKGRMGAEVELQELSAALTADFSISPDRIFLSGFSDGGFTALWLASHFPHLVAGIAPEVANWQYTNVEVVGLSNIPVLMVDGWFDGGYLESNFLRLFALDSMGADVAGIIGQHDHDTVPFEQESSFLRIMEWARTKRRNVYPKQIHYATWNLQWHQAYWVSIERMVEPALVARIDVAVGGSNTIEVRTRNVAAYTLSLSGKLVDPAQPVHVLTNGKQSYAGSFRPELTVEVVRLPKSRYAKRPETDGDILAAVDRDLYHERPQVPGRPWLWVRPTGGTEAQRRALAPRIPSWAVDDVKVADEQLQRCSLYLFGGPGLNRLADRIAGDLPVHFAPGRFSVGKKVYDHPDQWVKFVHPSPFNPRRSVIVYAFNDPVAAAAHDFWGGGSSLGEEGGREFRTGDCVVYGVPDLDKLFGTFLPSRAPGDYFIFGPNWGAPSGPILGVVEQPFDYLAIQQLKADALQEATGADAAVIWGFTPDYLRWRAYLRQGPVALQDLATIEPLPQYAWLCEVTGAQLKALALQAPFAAVRDPASLDDTKTYTLVTEYSVASSSVLTYAVNPSEMPSPFMFFDSMAEFAATSGAALGSRHLRLSDVEVTEALAQYVRRHRRISPRPSVGQLIPYLTSPQDNFDTGHDWHHLRLAAPFRDPKTGADVSRDVFLHAGFSWEGMPAVSPTEGRTKAFDRLEAGSFHRDLRGLLRHPPVTATGASRGVHLAGDRPARLVTVCYENSSDRPLRVLLALTSPSLRAEYGGTWPDANVEGPQPKSPYYLGFVDDLVSEEVPYSRQARLVLFPNNVPKTERLMLPNAGWNTGLIGFSWESVIPAHGALIVPVLLLSVDALDPSKPQLPDLGDVLEAARAGILSTAEQAYHPGGSCGEGRLQE